MTGVQIAYTKAIRDPVAGRMEHSSTTRDLLFGLLAVSKELLQPADIEVAVTTMSIAGDAQSLADAGISKCQRAAQYLLIDGCG